MKNSFNLEVHFSDAPLMCYEWETSSTITHVKLERVSTLFLKRVLTYEGKVDYKSNILLLSDTKNAVVLKLDKEGNIKARSFLKFEDALDVCEYAFNIKESKIEFTETEQKVYYAKRLSIEDEMREYLVSSIKRCSNEDFSRYLYYLYFDEVDDYSRDKLIDSINASSIDRNMKLYKFLIES
ncbi:MAG: hypothetical protein HFG33_00070 [Bacilli bacterium]|nr:hypothetical protein [Bacilli bacterium]